MSPGSKVASPRSITTVAGGTLLRTSAAVPTALMRSPTTYTAAPLTYAPLRTSRTRAARMTSASLAGTNDCANVWLEINAPARHASAPRLRIDLLLYAGQIRLGLIADDRQQISHRKVGIDQVQTPILEHLSIHHHVAGNVVGARATRGRMQGHRQIRAMLVHHAGGTQKPRHLDEGRGNRLLGCSPHEGYGHIIGSGGNASGRKVGVKHAGTAAKRSRIGADRLHAFRCFTKTGVIRWRHGRAETRECNDAPYLTVRTARRYVLEGPADVGALRHGQAGAHQDGRNELGLHR